MERISLEQKKIIKQKIDLNDKNFIIRVEVTSNLVISNEDIKRNVYCVNKDYEKIWQIKHDPNCPHSDVPFVDIKIKDNELIAKDFAGFVYKVDINNGETKVISWNK